MITGHKPHGYFQTFSGDGVKLQGEHRQCIHCQFSWRYNPGSGDIRGYCTRCDGFLCARDQCARIQKQRLIETNYPMSCISFHDYNRYRFDKYLKDHNYQVTTSGIFIPVTE